MGSRNRLILIGVGIFAVLVVIAVVSVPLLLNADSFRTGIESTLSSALGRQVALGKLDFSLWSGSLVAQKVSVADDPAFSNQPFLQASLVKIRVALLPFIFRRELHIRGFALVAPEITLLHAANGAWNYSSIVRSAARVQGTQAQAGAMIPDVTLGWVDLSDGTLNVGSGPIAGANAMRMPKRILSGLSLDIRNFSFRKSFPFTASARLPDEGSISLRGAAGPVNLRDVSLTPLTAHAEVNHLDLAVAGVLNASSGATGLIDDISTDLTWSGQHLQLINLVIDSPKLAIAHGVTQRSSELGARRGGSGMIATLSVNSLAVKNGVITVTSAGQPPGATVYRQVNLTASNYSSKTSSPFTLSAQLPGGGSLDVSGNVGPLNRRITATPLDAEISLKHADLAASGLLAPGSGIGGLLNLDARAASDGHTFNANGVANVQGLRLIKNGSPSPQPIDVRFAGTGNMQSHTGQLQHSTIAIGSAVINVQGMYDAAGIATQIGLKVDAPGILIDQIQAFLPSLGVKLPSGSRLQGGTLTTSLNITGPIHNTVVSGPLRLDNTQLTGFDLASKLSGVAPLTGLQPGSGTVIRSLSLNLHVADGVMRTDNVVLVVPALGSATGSGTIGAGGALDYHLLLKIAALSGGGTGVAGTGDTASRLMGMISSGVGQSIGGLSALAFKDGIPLEVGGTAASPTFTPNFSGMLGGKRQTAGNSLGKALGGLINGHR